MTEPSASAPPMTTSARDYHLVLPPGWVRIPLDDRAAERVVLLAAQQAAEAPTGTREGVRTRLVRLMQQAVREAQDSGGTDVLMSVGSVGRVPVSASCLVSFLPAEGVGLGQLEAQLREKGGSVEVVVVSGAPALRRSSQRELPYDEGQAVTLATGTGLPLEQLSDPVAHEVAYLVPLPGSRDLLAFTFTTAQRQLAEALVELFDAVMSTMRWVA